MMTRLLRYTVWMMCLMFLCTACSKDKTDDKATKRKSAPARVVDLGEDGAAADDKADAKKPQRGPKRERPKADDDKADAPSKDEAAQKNEKARFNEDGSPKRGKPAAQEDAEAAGEKGHHAKKADEPKANEPAKEEQAKEEQAKEEQAKDAPRAEAPADDVPSFDFADSQPKEEEITPRIVQKRQGLNIEDMLNIREFREHTGYSGTIIQSDLAGQPSDSRYNVIRLATDKDSQLGFTMQVWKPGNDSAASKRFDDLYKQSFGGVKQKDVASDAFAAAHHGINELGFYDKGKRAVVLLSCTSSICSPDSLKKLAGMLQKRL